MSFYVKKYQILEKVKKVKKTLDLLILKWYYYIALQQVESEMIFEN